ncbi:sodium-dependent phosphate transporter 1-A-like [Antedon mediterranea]|uniref:sodium-dependent phosphate transporter 1-A-like n=1 Tax=Antedon mediterranea TaxID=105859 RepID=UPI003AF98D29
MSITTIAGIEWIPSSSTINTILTQEKLTEALWIVIVGFIIGLFLAFFIGANDAANSFGTSYGAKALTIHQICILGSIFETLGAMLLGAGVSETIRSGIIDVSLYEGQETVLMLGQVSALIGSSIWLVIATVVRLPVSGTHSIVGAVIGYHVVVFGLEGIQWSELGKIVISWFTSPVLSGLLSIFFFYILLKTVLLKDNPLEPGLKSLPVWYSLVITVNFFSIFYNTSGVFEGIIPLYGVFILSFGSGILAGLIVFCVLVPRLRNKIQEMVPIMFHADSNEITDIQKNTNDETSQDEQRQSRVAADDECVDESATLCRDDHPIVVQLCSPLLILSAVFSSFSHGGNDVSNAIGPVISIWVTYETGEVDTAVETPLWILFLGGVAISLGLWLLGKRVIQVLGEEITMLTPSSSFTIELGSALTVLTASNLGIPISTTHCKVGSIVAVGSFRSGTSSVDWSLFRNIAISWFLTVPTCLIFSAVSMELLMFTV